MVHVTRLSQNFFTGDVADRRSETPKPGCLVCLDLISDRTTASSVEIGPKRRGSKTDHERPVSARTVVSNQLETLPAMTIRSNVHRPDPHPDLLAHIGVSTKKIDEELLVLLADSIRRIVRVQNRLDVSQKSLLRREGETTYAMTLPLGHFSTVQIATLRLWDPFASCPT